MKQPIIILFSLLSLTCQSQQSNRNLLNNLKQAIQSEVYPNIDAIIVSKSDTVILDEYFDEFTNTDLHDTRSSFKSITSILAGIAIDKGLIKLDDKMLKYFPEYKIKDSNDNKKERITIKDIIEMKSGLACEEFYETGPNCEDDMELSEDWVQYSINRTMKYEPGKTWSYNSIDPMILGNIISTASGISIMDFAKKHLFEPLGITKYKWTLTPKGRGMTAGSFYMSPSDMLKIGKLIKQEGQWNDMQIVSKNWIQLSTECQTKINFSFVGTSRMDTKYENTRYGFYWYRENIKYGDICTEVLFASGNGGQYIMLLKEYDAIIVFSGSNYGNWRGKLPFEIALKYLIPIIEGKS